MPRQATPTTRLLLQFIGIGDADFVPMVHLLRRAFSLLRDRDVGIAQTPPLHQSRSCKATCGQREFGPGEQRYFFDVVMAKGRLGTCHAGRLGARPSGKTI